MTMYYISFHQDHNRRLLHTMFQKHQNPQPQRKLPPSSNIFEPSCISVGDECSAIVGANECCGGPLTSCSAAGTCMCQRKARPQINASQRMNVMDKLGRSGERLRTTVLGLEICCLLGFLDKIDSICLLFLILYFHFGKNSIAPAPICHCLSWIDLIKSSNFCKKFNWRSTRQCL